MIDTWLNIATAVGTIGAVMVSLFLSGKETRLNKAKEIKNDKIIKEIIFISLKKSLDRMLRYREVIENAQFLYKARSGVEIEHLYHDAFNTSAFSYKANYVFTSYLNMNLKKDILFISTQLIVLKNMDINRMSLKWVNTYYEALSQLILLEESLKEINEMEKDYDRIGAFLKNYNNILNPIEKSVEALKE